MTDNSRVKIDTSFVVAWLHFINGDEKGKAEAMKTQIWKYMYQHIKEFRRESNYSEDIFWNQCMNSDVDLADLKNEIVRNLNYVNGIDCAKVLDAVNEGLPEEYALQGDVLVCLGLGGCFSQAFRDCVGIDITPIHWFPETGEVKEKYIEFLENTMRHELHHMGVLRMEYDWLKDPADYKELPQKYADNILLEGTANIVGNESGRQRLSENDKKTLKEKLLLVTGWFEEWKNHEKDEVISEADWKRFYSLWSDNLAFIIGELGIRQLMQEKKITKTADCIKMNSVELLCLMMETEFMKET